MSIRAKIALAALGFAAAAGPSGAGATNYALSNEGASFVSASSAIQQGTFGFDFNYSIMQANLLTNTPTAEISDGDTRYLFDANDPNGTIIIDLGQVRQIDSIGATVDLPGSDRPISGPFTVEVSTNGSSYTAWGSQVVTGGSTNPLTITGATQGVQYIEYEFGDTGTPYGNGGGGAGVSQLFATSAVPEPSAWALMIVGVGGLGATLRTRRRGAIAV